MNAMERLKVAIEIAERFVAVAKRDEQGLSTWIEAVGYLGRELHDSTEFFMPAPGAVLIDARELDRKRDLIRKALHTAWGNSKNSPDYQKGWWRVLSIVLEHLTCSTEPATLEFLRDLTIPSDPEQPT